MAQTVDDNLIAAREIVTELRQRAVGVLHRRQPTAIVVNIPRHGRSITILNRRDVMREFEIIVMIFIGGIRAGVAIYQFEDLNQVSRVVVVHIPHCRHAIASTVGITQRGNPSRVITLEQGPTCQVTGRRS